MPHYPLRLSDFFPAKKFFFPDKYKGYMENCSNITETLGKFIRNIITYLIKASDHVCEE